MAGEQQTFVYDQKESDTSVSKYCEQNNVPYTGFSNGANNRRIAMFNTPNRNSLVFLIVIGMLSGTAFMLNSLSISEGEISKGTVYKKVLIGACLGPVMFWIMSTALLMLLRYFGLNNRFIDRFRSLSYYSFSMFLVLFLGSQGVVFGVMSFIALLFIWLFFQALIGIFLHENEADEGTPGSVRWITFLFLISGAAALIYQVVWQRVLFTALGINIESITLIVSIFMFGLGVGAIIGGKLSVKYPQKLPLLFVICEISIGIFGLFSISLIKFITGLVAGSSLISIALTVYGLLMIPTMMMGATLPILVKYLHQYYEHVGQSVGSLYWINTIGSAMACFVTVDILFRIGGLQTSIFIAASLNIVIGVIVFFYMFRQTSRA